VAAFVPTRSRRSISEMACMRLPPIHFDHD
jgi:hypothetical protein